jgi:hypothetical protein
MMRRTLLALLALSLTACGRACSGGEVASDAAAPQEGASTAQAAPACRQIGAHALAAGRPVVVGGAARSANAFLVGAVVGGGDGVVFRVADGKEPEAIAVGALRGDAPAPLPLVDGDAVLVAYRAAEGLLVRPLGEGPPRWRIELPSGGDTGFDVSVAGGRGLAVYEEPRAAGDAVKAVWLGTADAGASAPLALRAPAHDVDGLRIVRAGAAYWVLWLARTLEVIDADVAEGTRDREGPAFVEGVRIAEGGAAGAVVTITPSGGRVTGFDVRAAGDGVEVFLRDASDGDEAARLVKVLVSEGSAPVREILAEGIGRAAPALVESGAVSFVQLTDASEHAFLLSTADKGRVELPTDEGIDVRAMGLVGGSTPSPVLLAAALGPHGAVELRSFSCPNRDAGR